MQEVKACNVGVCHDSCSFAAEFHITNVTAFSDEAKDSKSSHLRHQWTLGHVAGMVPMQFQLWWRCLLPPPRGEIGIWARLELKKEKVDDCCLLLGITLI